MEPTAAKAANTAASCGRKRKLDTVRTGAARSKSKAAPLPVAQGPQFSSKADWQSAQQAVRLQARTIWDEFSARRQAAAPVAAQLEPLQSGPLQQREQLQNSKFDDRPARGERV